MKKLRRACFKEEKNRKETLQEWTQAVLKVLDTDASGLSAA